MLYDNVSNSSWSNKHLFGRIEEMKEITMRAKELNELLGTLSENRSIRIEEMPELFTTTQQREAVSLKQLSEMFGVPSVMEDNL